MGSSIANSGAVSRGKSATENTGCVRYKTEEVVVKRLWEEQPAKADETLR